MIEFHPVRLSDKPWVEEALNASSQRGCEYHFATLYAWCHAYHVTIARVADMFTERIGTAQAGFLFPVGTGSLAQAVEELEDYSSTLGLPLAFHGVTPENQAALEALFPGKFTFTPKREGFDYLYTVEQLSTLAGRKYSGKRNHINRFLAENDNWLFEPLTPALLPECLAMAEEWYLRSNENRPEDAGSLAQERTALLKCLDNFTLLDLEGGLLRVDGAVAAFTLGGKLSPGSDTFDVQFEKALLSYEGAFPMINREFARHIAQVHPEVRYLNREEDMGVPGLRRAKESYYPAALVEKQIARAY